MSEPYYFALFVQNEDMDKALDDIQSEGDGAGGRLKIENIKSQDWGYIVTVKMGSRYPFVENQLRERWSKRSW